MGRCALWSQVSGALWSCKAEHALRCLHACTLAWLTGWLPPPPQEKLEPAYRSELRGAYGIEFNSLLALNNMPIKRFADYLVVRSPRLCASQARVLCGSPGC